MGTHYVIFEQTSLHRLRWQENKSLPLARYVRSRRTCGTWWRYHFPFVCRPYALLW